ncbi:hypothetical protein [Spirosoma linguale]|uniref:hypothetical protein n=1 Tax=Spirosoma linguale TaxID=108 RepID=UPI003CC7D8F6
MTTSYHPLGSLQKGYPAPSYSLWLRFTHRQAVYRLTVDWLGVGCTLLCAVWQYIICI